MARGVITAPSCCWADGLMPGMGAGMRGVRDGGVRIEKTRGVFTAAHLGVRPTQLPKLGRLPKLRRLRFRGGAARLPPASCPSRSPGSKGFWQLLFAVLHGDAGGVHAGEEQEEPDEGVSAPVPALSKSAFSSFGLLVAPKLLRTMFTCSGEPRTTQVPPQAARQSSTSTGVSARFCAGGARCEMFCADA